MSDFARTATGDPILYDPAALGKVRALLEEVGASPNRVLGQNFLVNSGVLDRIVTTAQITKDDAALEIGPGLGALTCRLAATAGQVVAIEKDAQFPDLLARYLPAGNLKVISGDALEIDWSELGLPDQNVKVVANLPYSISKPILRRLFEEWRPHLATATLTVQREVAQRLVALPSTSAYGPMAIMATLHGATKKVFDISPGSFWPAPEVVSSVVHIQMRPTPAVALNDEKLFWRLVRAAFAQRRKQLGNTLRAAVPRDVLTPAMEQAEINPQRRGETLSLEEFARLSNLLAS